MSAIRRRPLVHRNDHGLLGRLRPRTGAHRRRWHCRREGRCEHRREVPAPLQWRSICGPLPRQRRLQISTHKGGLSHHSELRQGRSHCWRGHLLVDSGRGQHGEPRAPPQRRTHGLHTHEARPRRRRLLDEALPPTTRPQLRRHRPVRRAPKRLPRRTTTATSAAFDAATLGALLPGGQALGAAQLNAACQGYDLLISGRRLHIHALFFLLHLRIGAAARLRQSQGHLFAHQHACPQ
mmetsp:Transcript_168432/g.541220  ORF Transcript_168432/g.541220 Transcript_168432/m.541220 type:complete len:237 (-) Transcript_168432:38-748(-)